MSTQDKIVKLTQHLDRYEQSLALESIKKRRADTRRKIELGGLIIKAGMDGFNKSVILGAITYAMELIGRDETCVLLFESVGDNLFL